MFLTACGHGAAPPASESPEAVPAPNTIPPELAGQANPIDIRIPAIKLDSTNFVPSGVDSTGAIEVPTLDQLDEIRWYCPRKAAPCGAPTPGDKGPAVVLAHVNGHGKPGPFANLDQLKAGDLVEVDRSDNKTAVFKISRVVTIGKNQFPTKEVYGNVDHPALRLITCGGQYDPKAKRYLDQVIAYGDLTELRTH